MKRVEFEIGDLVHENWSGLTGTVEWIRGEEAGVRYPQSGRIVVSHLQCLKKATHKNM